MVRVRQFVAPALRFAMERVKTDQTNEAQHVWGAVL
ncbi:protein of unknown function [Ralstonia solanacearum CMR15]|nr:protein of unknown function [Ralstonia solanacearum CMR15]